MQQYISRLLLFRPHHPITQIFVSLFFLIAVHQTFASSCGIITSLANQFCLSVKPAEADLWPGWCAAAEKGFGDGVEAVEADQIPPANYNTTNSTSERRVLLPVQNHTCPG